MLLLTRMRRLFIFWFIPLFTRKLRAVRKKHACTKQTHEKSNTETWCRFVMLDDFCFSLLVLLIILAQLICWAKILSVCCLDVNQGGTNRSHRDFNLQSLMHRLRLLTKWSHSKNFRPVVGRRKWAWIAFLEPAEPHSLWDVCCFFDVQ